MLFISREKKHLRILDQGSGDGSVKSIIVLIVTGHTPHIINILLYLLQKETSLTRVNLNVMIVKITCDN